MRIPRVVIAGATSGVGKTAVSCAIIYSLSKRGYSVQPFKVGPDYIDPSLLVAVSGGAARNLDPWLMGGSAMKRNFVSRSTADVSIIEGVMGYYDGFAGSSNLASTFDVASRLACPVILVLDASRTARSIAAIATGFAKFHKNSRIAGVVLNMLGSKKHERLCREAMEACKMPILGAVPRSDSLKIRSRHLGLVPAAEAGQAHAVRRAAGEIADRLDIDRILAICNSAKPLAGAPARSGAKRRAVIGVALDSSFNFYYQENLDALRLGGAELKFFSPTSDSGMPECDGMYIGGGFPEVQGPQLAENCNMRRSVREAAEGGIPIYAECGGLMYLTRSIRYGAKKYPMAGLFDAETVMTERMVLNYAEGETVRSSIVSGPGERLRAHEFHYSRLGAVPQDAEFAYRLSAGDGISDGRDGLVLYGTLASYCHRFLADKHARSIVNSCVRFSRR